MVKYIFNRWADGSVFKGSAVLGLATLVFMMIRNAQKDSKELQLKLDELIAAIEKDYHPEQDKLNYEESILIQDFSNEQNVENKEIGDDEKMQEPITYYRYK